MIPISPKELFQTDIAKASEHRALVQNPRLVDALMVALNEHGWRLPLADNPQTSWAANARRQGAKELLEIFLTLGDPPVARKPMIAGQLENEDATTHRSASKHPTKPGNLE